MAIVVDPPLHEGDRTACQKFLRGMTGYYVYALCRPDGRPFYIGKGKGDRVFYHENEASHPNDRRSNAHKLNVIRAILREGEQVRYRIMQRFEDEARAYMYEETLIGKLGRLHENGPLTNRDPGGGSIRMPSPFSRDKSANTLGGIPVDDPETATLNSFVLGIAPMDSVVLKPLSRFRPRPTRPFENKVRHPTLRQAAALAATASANGIVLESEATLPRKVMIDGVEGFVENGVSRDIATSGMATLRPADDPADEQFTLSGRQASAVVAFIGLDKAQVLGLTRRLP